ncbi:MAG: eco29kIR domain protein [Verrucomicrobiota bacterium]|jgi:hypothetical protein
MPSTVFNPLDKTNLGKSVVDALMATSAVPLGGMEKFSGAGVYALYYSGDFAPYGPLAQLNRASPSQPIYIGKAVPKGGRKGLQTDDSQESTALWERLAEHAASVEAGAGLALKDFSCRVLVLDDIWIGLGESLLIQRFNPLWNQVVEGFGNHDPGKGRRKGKRPVWDELHPGRAWALRCKPAALSGTEIEALVAAWMAQLSAARP